MWIIVCIHMRESSACDNIPLKWDAMSDGNADRQDRKEQML